MERYALIVTEKPDAAYRIASALDINGKPKRNLQNGVPYYEVNRNEKIVVVPSLGHLYTVSATTKGKYPIFDYEWVPRYKAERKARRVRTWLQTIEKLAEKADTFIDACDYDIEGSIIGYCILKYACGGKEKEAKRMKYSTLTDEELQDTYTSPLPHLDFGLIEAGLARHEIDWLYGINLSTALTTSAKNHSKQYTTLSTGRVQGPTLRLLVLREKQIANFVPQPYWIIEAQIKIGNERFTACYEKGPFRVKDLAKAVLEQCRGKDGKVEEVKTKEYRQSQPFPFDLGSLQSDSYRFFRYTPLRTSSIAQRLYLEALISYPRTSSQKLPRGIDFEKILKNLSKNRAYTRLAEDLLAKSELKPTEGKKADSAHPAIYPTGKLPQKNLSGPEKAIYDLIVRRFMATFAEASLRQDLTVTLNVGGQRFLLNGRQTLLNGWLRFCLPSMRLQDSPLPAMTKGEKAQVQKVTLDEKITKPPARYNPASILRQMERYNIGTKATRAGILQTLFDRKYIREKQITVTDLGLEIDNVMKKYCPSVVSAKLTQQLEEKMKQVQLGQKTKAQIISEVTEILKPIMKNFAENEQYLGEQLSSAIAKSKLQEHLIGKCPNCQNGNLIVQYSKKTGKRFVGCTSYFNGTCQTSFPIPQKGYTKPSGKLCPGCGWSTIRVWLKGKHPWNLCLNPKCPKKNKQEK